jgi:hypothetical protein
MTAWEHVIRKRRNPVFRIKNGSNVRPYVARNPPVPRKIGTLTLNSLNFIHTSTCLKFYISHIP